jgi:hypothetical protein
MLAVYDFIPITIPPKAKLSIHYGKGAEMIALYLSSACVTSLTLRVEIIMRISLFLEYYL